MAWNPECVKSSPHYLKLTFNIAVLGVIVLFFLIFSSEVSGRREHISLLDSQINSLQAKITKITELGIEHVEPDSTLPANANTENLQKYLQQIEEKQERINNIRLIGVKYVGVSPSGRASAEKDLLEKNLPALTKDGGKFNHWGPDVSQYSSNFLIGLIATLSGLAGAIVSSMRRDAPFNDQIVEMSSGLIVGWMVFLATKGGKGIVILDDHMQTDYNVYGIAFLALLAGIYTNKLFSAAGKYLDHTLKKDPDDA